MNQSRNNKIKENIVFHDIVKKMGGNIFVTDIETDEILFMNQHMKDALYLEHPEGNICWKTLQKDVHRRCYFCPLRFLDPSQPEKSSCLWEEKNTINGRLYEHYAGLTTWFDGRVVYFQYSIDITEMSRLNDTNYIDELTGILNRHTGKEQLQRVIHDCFEGKTRAIAGIIDINDLKMINDTLGYHQGDQLIIRITEMVKEDLQPEDLFFRLRGDEFVAVYLNRSLQEVTSLFEQMLCRLAENPLYPQLERAEEFCYGLYEIGTSVYLSAEQVLSKADEALYQHKRSFHIQKAIIKLRETPIVLEPDQFFYDEASLYEALVNSTDDYLFICNLETGIFQYSQRMVNEFDMPGQVIKNAVAFWEPKVYETDKKRYLEGYQDVIDGRTDNHILEYRVLDRKGNWVWLRCRGRVIHDATGKAVLFAGFITNLGKKNQIDSITGLYNKIEFESELEWYLKKEKDQSAAVILFGLDDFKRINTLYDYSFGDEVIRIISQKISSLLPSTTVLYRMDSDQFGLILRHADKSSVLSFFKELQQQLSTWQIFDEKRFYCTLSCGCVFLTPEHDSYLPVMKEASHALDRAKFYGKNRIEFFSPKDMSNIQRSLTMTEFLRESIERQFQGFSVHYQPIFTLDRHLKGAEALCRWENSVYGSVRPDIFIGLLEESRLILQVGRWVFQQAVLFCKECLKVQKNFTMQVNLSYLQLEDPSFFDFVKSTLEVLQVPPTTIILELTESYLAENLTRLTEMLSHFRNLGIKIAMDDFGTGYSSLGVLRNTPLDLVKIDQCFVREIQHQKFDRSCICMVVELCHTINTPVCLEGLETEQQYQIIHEMGVDYLQGFLLSRPLTQVDFKNRYLTM